MHRSLAVGQRRDLRDENSAAYPETPSRLAAVHSYRKPAKQFPSEPLKPGSSEAAKDHQGKRIRSGSPGRQQIQEAAAERNLPIAKKKAAQQFTKRPKNVSRFGLIPVDATASTIFSSSQRPPSPILRVIMAYGAVIPCQRDGMIRQRPAVSQVLVAAPILTPQGGPA